MAYSNACTNNIEQWASVVYSFSSEYDSEGWAANQVIGPPQVYPQYGDIEGAWASEDTNSVEYIEIGFEQQVIPSVIKLYETYHAGGISKIMAKNPAGHWVTLYTAPKLEIINSSRVFSPNLTGNTFETNQLWIEIDSSLAKSWVEIDAVQLIGSLPGHYDSRRRTAEVENITQWVAEVTDFSSQYNSSGWSANSVIGVPKVYPRYGDIQGAWASADKNADQFIQVKFQKKVFLREINIYETYHAGGVKNISAKDMQGNWVMVYKTHRLQNIEKSRIFSPSFNPPHFPVDELRLDIDCTACGTWVEIDAVNIVGTLRPGFTPLSASFSQLVNNKMFSDVEIVIDGLTFYAHKAILAKRSLFFKSIFVDGQVPTLARQQRNPPSSQRVMPSCPPSEEEAPPTYDSLFGEPPMPSKIHNLPTKEQLYGDQINSGQVNKVTPTQPESKTEIPLLSAGGPLVLHNVTPDVFWIVLYFIYTDEFPESINIFNVPAEIDTNCLIRACRAAVEFDLPGLNGLSMRRLTTHTSMTADNAIEVYTEATREPVLEFVSKLALQIMVQHSNSIKKHAKFNRLPPNVQKMISSESEGTASVEKKKSSIKRNSSDVCSLQ